MSSMITMPRVLLVEDNPDDAELAELAFADCAVRHELVIAWDGEEALHYVFGADEPPHDFALVLLDIGLPKLDGFAVLKEMRARGLKSPVIMLSSSNLPHDRERAFESGANGYIQKPVDFFEFSDVVKEMARNWLPQNFQDMP